jgi:hypothetical protein
MRWGGSITRCQNHPIASGQPRFAPYGKLKGWGLERSSAGRFRVKTIITTAQISTTQYPDTLRMSFSRGKYTPQRGRRDHGVGTGVATTPVQNNYIGTEWGCRKHAAELWSALDNQDARTLTRALKCNEDGVRVFYTVQQLQK